MLKTPNMGRTPMSDDSQRALADVRTLVSTHECSEDVRAALADVRTLVSTHTAEVVS